MIVCPETPALRAERGDSPMFCEAQPALIVIFKKSQEIETWPAVTFSIRKWGAAP
jgi:hypothetical protein